MALLRVCVAPTGRFPVLLVLAAISAVNIALTLRQSGAPAHLLGRLYTTHASSGTGPTPTRPSLLARYRPAHASIKQDTRPWSSHNRVLVTGAAGFIGYHTSKSLVYSRDTFVLGIDNFSPNYGISLKHKRRDLLQQCCSITVIHGDIRNRTLLQHLFEHHSFSVVIHMAAWAGVQQSAQHPVEYILNNEVGTVTLLEVMRQQNPRPALVYASSSSVYGVQASDSLLVQKHWTACADTKSSSNAASNEHSPMLHSSAHGLHSYHSQWATYRKVLGTASAMAGPQTAANKGLHPTPECAVGSGHVTSVYAATKLATERLVEVYSNQYGLVSTGLRFFTVYGPWGRPDMAVMKFSKQLLQKEAITLTCFISKRTTQVSSRISRQHDTEVQRHGQAATSIDSNTDMLKLGRITSSTRPNDCVLPYRDFTYIDDIVQGVLLAVAATRERVKQQLHGHKIYNLGRGQPIDLGMVLQELEGLLGQKAALVQYKLSGGSSADVFGTWADTEAAERDLGFKARTAVQRGLQMFVDWYVGYATAPPGV